MLNRFEAFTVLITKINRDIKKIKAEEMEKFNLKSPHVSCLYYVYRDGSLTSKQLTELCKEDKASVSRSIEYLEANGYLIKADNHKKYKTPIELTLKGRAVAERISERIDVLLKAVGDGLTVEEREILYKSLNIISDNLHKICEAY